MLSFLTTLSRPAKQGILLSLDVLLVPVSFLLAEAITAGQLPTLSLVVDEWRNLFLLTLAAAGLSMALGLPRVQLKSYEFSAFARSATLASVLAGLLGAMVLSETSTVEVGAPIILALVYTALSGGVRLTMLKALIAIYSQDVARTRVLIYGAGTTGIQLALALKADRTVRVLCFVDDNKVLHNLTVAGLAVHPAQNIKTLLTTHAIDRVLLAMPSVSPPKLAQIARRIAVLGVEVQTLPSFAQLIGQEAIIDKLAPALPNQMLGRPHLNDALRDGCAAYVGKVVMITGAGGSIGSELCRQILHCKPAKLVLLEITEFTLFQIDRELRALTEGSDCAIVPVLGSILDSHLLMVTLARHKVQVVLHAAAYKHVPMLEANPIVGVRNNVFGTQCVAQAAQGHGVERFVLISTDKAVRPLSIMGATKRLTETIVGDMARRSTSTIFTMVRFGNVLGSSGSVVPIFNEQIARGGPVTVTDKKITRYFMTVEEACRLVLWAGTLAGGGEIFVLDMGKPIRIADLARQLVAAAGYSVRDAGNPDGDIEIRTIGLRAGEKLHEELSVNPELRPTRHPKLFRAHETCLSEFELARAMQTLAARVEQGDSRGLVDEILRWVRRDLENNLQLIAAQHDS